MEERAKRRRAIVRGETVLLHRLQSPPSVSLPLLLFPSNSYSLFLFVRTKNILIIWILCFCTSHVPPFPLLYSSPVSSFFVAECFLLPVSLGWSILLIAFSEILKFMYFSPPYYFLPLIPRTFPSSILFHVLSSLALTCSVFSIIHGLPYPATSLASALVPWVSSSRVFYSFRSFPSDRPSTSPSVSPSVSTFVHLRISLKRCLRRRQR